MSEGVSRFGDVFAGALIVVSVDVAVRDTSEEGGREWPGLGFGGFTAAFD